MGNNSIFFDIGANVGNRTEAFLKLNASVVAVEPVKTTFNELVRKFGNHQKATLLNCGLGSKEGNEIIYISEVSQVCTLSEKFIDAYKNQRDISISWNKSLATKIKTLDHLIDEYGVPDFCKIDVEGYELEVLKGLTAALPMLSFEYNARLKEIAIACLDYLAGFSNLTFNFSAYESMEFEFRAWKNNTEMKKFICKLPESLLTGDVYVKHESSN